MLAPLELPLAYFPARDGERLAYRDSGEGRPLVLLHGLLANADAHWVRSGHAAMLIERGHRVILPDLRGHGDSATPHDPAAYPPDVLCDDGFALLEHLGLDEYDLGGYSLGARTTVRMLARGARPGRAIVAGMGLEGLTHTAGRGGQFREILTKPGTFAFGSAEWKAEAFLEKTGGDREALLLVMGTSVDTTREQLAAIPTPTLVLVGDRDERHESAEQLAEVLPHARFARLPGDHSSAPRTPELGLAIADFLAGLPASAAPR